MKSNTNKETVKWLGMTGAAFHGLFSVYANMRKNRLKKLVFLAFLCEYDIVSMYKDVLSAEARAYARTQRITGEER